mmetsp:Transcript_5382/g.16378  ORF Transcript_5382/g.16378 Transcript_5382/m.16378 type:complete len:220 (-) Transcript_5382:552-1211(-)
MITFQRLPSPQLWCPTISSASLPWPLMRRCVTWRQPHTDRRFSLRHLSVSSPKASSLNSRHHDTSKCVKFLAVTVASVSMVASSTATTVLRESERKSGVSLIIKVTAALDSCWQRARDISRRRRPFAAIALAAASVSATPPSRRRDCSAVHAPRSLVTVLSHSALLQSERSKNLSRVPAASAMSAMRVPLSFSRPDRLSFSKCDSPSTSSGRTSLSPKW